MTHRICVVVLVLLMVTACAGREPTPAPVVDTPAPEDTDTRTSAQEAASSQPTPDESLLWTVEGVTFDFGPNELSGILTLPHGDGPFPALVLISGSVNIETGTRTGATSGYFREHSRTLAQQGFAVLRYDPPGVGQSTGEAGFESLDIRAEEAAAALHYVQSRPDIQAGGVGLLGISQGGWVIAMAAARYPQDVAFVVSVSGSGVSVAEQQVHSIRAQSEAASMPGEDVTKAVLIGRLLIDWQLDAPIFREVNEANALSLGDGPWNEFMELVYEPGDVTPAESFQQGIVILRSIQDEPWAEFLYLKELYLPQMEMIPPDQVEAVRALTGPTLLEDPEEYWTKVTCPVLAVFGEDDLLQPSAVSAALYEEYLTAAGNKDFRIVVLPDVGHGVGLWVPAYADTLSEWLAGIQNGRDTVSTSALP
jgi:pimeloyl-ACP methyl ester carboxylesterase